MGCTFDCDSFPVVHRRLRELHLVQSRSPYYLHRDRVANKQRDVVLRKSLHVLDLHCLVNHAGRDSLGVN